MSILQQFPQAAYFSTRRVQAGVELEAIFGLRYQVYCEERGFLPRERYPQQQESDEFDHQAVHFAAFDQDGQVAAAVRLVMPVADRGLPCQQHCDLFDDVAKPPPALSVEVSRLVLNKHHRTPPGGGCVGTVVLGLYREMYQFSRQSGISHWYAAMEKPLARLLARYGFRFDLAGPESDYYGPVSAYLADLSVLERRLAKESPALHKWFSCSW